MTSEGKGRAVLATLPLARAAANQRRTVMLAAALAAASLLVGASFGRWDVGLFVAIGVLLGLVNSVLTELSLVRFADSVDLLSRKQFAMSALLRLMGVSLIAFVLTVAFWPAGATVLVGLAGFQLITVVFTGFPLIKELRKA
jgi:hypothetical protein